MSASRIVSLLPSVTETVSFISRVGGVPNTLVGVTHECDWPPEVVSKAERVTTSEITPHTMSQAEIDKRVSGMISQAHSLYGLKADKLEELQPTLILTQALCDVCAPSYRTVVSTVARVLGDSPRVVSIEPSTLTDVIESVRQVGREMGAEEAGIAAAKQLEDGFQRIRNVVAAQPSRPKVAFLEWTDPLFNGGHWIPELIEAAGGRYDMARSGARSVRVEPEALVATDADVIFVAPCGMDHQRAAADAAALWKQAWWRDLRAVRNNQVYAVDGNAYYARPGPRLLQGCGVLAALLHGEGVRSALGDELVPPGTWVEVRAPLEGEASAPAVA